MSKSISTLAALVFAASLGGMAFAADEPATQASDPVQKEQELQAALKKCESLASAEKQKCIETAKKKFGQM
jgi:hypothetical protein